MNKREFLQKLTEYLSYELPQRFVEKNVRYYSDYIDDELGKGRTSKDILDDLGDPQLIAKSIIDAAKSGRTAVTTASTSVFLLLITLVISLIGFLYPLAV